MGSVFFILFLPPFPFISLRTSVSHDAPLVRRRTEFSKIMVSNLSSRMFPWPFEAEELSLKNLLSSCFYCAATKVTIPHFPFPFRPFLLSIITIAKSETANLCKRLQTPEKTKEWAVERQTSATNQVSHPSSPSQSPKTHRKSTVEESTEEIVQATAVRSAPKPRPPWLALIPLSLR
jgi:hypothetical protein